MYYHLGTNVGHFFRVLSSFLVVLFRSMYSSWVVPYFERVQLLGSSCNDVCDTVLRFGYHDIRPHCQIVKVGTNDGIGRLFGFATILKMDVHRRGRFVRARMLEFNFGGLLHLICVRDAHRVEGNVFVAAWEQVVIPRWRPMNDSSVRHLRPVFSYNRVHVSISGNGCDSLVGRAQDHGFAARTKPIFSFPVSYRREFIGSSIVLRVASGYRYAIFKRFRITTVIAFEEYVTYRPGFHCNRIKVILCLVSGPISVDGRINVVLVITRRCVFIRLGVRVNYVYLTALLRQFCQQDRVARLVAEYGLFIRCQYCGNVIALASEAVNAANRLFAWGRLYPTRPFVVKWSRIRVRDLKDATLSFLSGREERFGVIDTRDWESFRRPVTAKSNCRCQDWLLLFFSFYESRSQYGRGRLLYDRLCDPWVGKCLRIRLPSFPSRVILSRTSVAFM